MSHHDPSDVPLITWAWVAGLSLLSSIAGYLSRYNNGKPVKRPVLFLIQDIAYCELAGLSTYFMAQAANLTEMQAVLLVAIGSHMGARLIFLLQNIVAKQIRMNAAAEQEE